MKPYHLILLCAGAAAFLTSFVEVSAAIRYVPSQYPSVQLAVEAAVNGDTVLVADGTYYENVRFRGKR